MWVNLDLTEVAFTEVISSASVISLKENIAPRRTIVYQTLMDPAVARIEGEKNKNKLFNRFLFRLNSPEEIEFVSIEKHYEPYIVVSGRHLVDYYRKCSYSVTLNEGVTEVILFGRTLTPRQSSYSSVNGRNIKLEGEERLMKETRSFLILNKYGQDSKLEQFPSAPSEENPQKLIKSFKMQEIASDVDLDAIRKRIVQRPSDINRIITEELEVDERSVIYTPRYRLTYKCPRIGKEASLEYDAVTLKQLKQNENLLLARLNDVASKTKSLFDDSIRWRARRV